MKVVLLQDVTGVGRKSEVKNVSDGYALNFLFPRKLAQTGTPHAIAGAERARVQAEAEQKIHADLIQKNLKSLEDVVVEMSGKASEKGHLFSGIHKEVIVAELKKQKGVDLLPEFIILPHPIKAVGEHVIPVKTQGKTASFKLLVRAE